MAEDNISKEFNEQTNEEVSPRLARKNRQSLTKIIPYSEAEGELKAKMDRIIDQIDRDPTSFKIISSLGSAPLKRLGDLSNSLIDLQSRFNDQVNVMKDAVKKVEAAQDDLKLGELMDALDTVKKGGLKTVGAGVGLASRMVKGGVEWATGEKKKREESNKLINELSENLPELHLRMRTMIDSLDGARDGLEEVLDTCIRFGKERVLATSELNVYLGVKDEIKRRYDEIYIPEAKETYDETKDPEDEMYLRQTIDGKVDFLGKMNALNSSQVQGITSAEALRVLMDNIKDQIKIIDNMQNVNKPEWSALMFMAGVSGSSLKVGQTIDAAAQLGDQIHDFAMDAQDKAIDLTLENKGRGTIDPQKILDSMSRVKGHIEQQRASFEMAEKQIESSFRQLREGADRLLEASESSQKARILESSDSSASNDNAASSGASRKSGNAPKR